MVRVLRESTFSLDVLARTQYEAINFVKINRPRFIFDKESNKEFGGRFNDDENIYIFKLKNKFFTRGLSREGKFNRDKSMVF